MAWVMFKGSESYNPRDIPKPQINLSWGMDTLDHLKRDQLSRPKEQSLIIKSKLRQQPGQIHQSQPEQLLKIVKSYEKKQKSRPVHPLDHNSQRTDTEQSRERLRYLENSLLPANPAHPRDTMGAILNHESNLENSALVDSRVSRRSASGNKKNQSKVVIGDGMYNSFVVKPEKGKDFHDRLMEMYKYEEERKSRKVSQIAM